MSRAARFPQRTVEFDGKGNAPSGRRAGIGFA